MLFALSYILQTSQTGQVANQQGMIYCAIGFFSIPWLLRFGLPRNICANLYVFLTFTSTVWESYWTGGVVSPTYFWFCMTPLAAIFLDTRRSGLVWLALALAAILAFAAMTLTGYQFPVETYTEYIPHSLITASFGLAALLTIIAVVMESAYIRSMASLSEKNKVIQEEKQRADELLRNILPEETMQELKATGHTTARSYELVTVLFADFKDFTILSQQMSAEELVQGIDEYFEAFDRIVEKYDVEKIKTVGDAYICASGLPEVNKDNPCIIIGVGLEMLAAVNSISERRRNLGLHTFEVRVGVHSGPLVAGVVGIKKFAYDIWGDTVNTAARMQQSSDPGRINISGDTYELVKNDFNCEHRGKIEAKHKGAIDMYFVGKGYRA